MTKLEIVVGNSFHVAGDTLTGSLLASCSADISISAARAVLIGRLYIKWRSPHNPPEAACRTDAEFVRLNLLSSVAEQPIVSTNGASFSWPFSIRLPTGLPCSAEFENGSVRFSIEAVLLTRGTFSRNITATAPVSILSADVGAPLPTELSASIARQVVPVTRGSHELLVALPRTAGVFQGQLTMRVMLNNRSFAPNKLVTAVVEQHARLIIQASQSHRDEVRVGTPTSASLLVSEFQVGTAELTVQLPSLSTHVVPNFEMDGHVRVAHALRISCDHVSLCIPLRIVHSFANVSLLATQNQMLPTLPTIWRPRWTLDREATECQACEAAFGLFTRRHHCRACGGVFCATCADDTWRQVLPPVFGYGDDLQRVCARCRNQPGGPAPAPIKMN